MAGTQTSRLRVLRPFFERIYGWNQRIPGAAEERPATIIIGSQRLPVEPWERRQIELWPRAVGEEPDARRCRLVMEALACMAKTLGDLERPGPSAGSNAPQQAELLLDGAIGIALQQEVQNVIDEDAREGRFDAVDEWGALLQRLRRTVDSTLERLDESEHERARHLASTLTDLHLEETPPAEPTSDATPLEVEDEVVIEPPEPPRPRRRRGPAPAILDGLDDLDRAEVGPERPGVRPTGLQRRTVLLALAFASSVLLWATIAGVSALLRDEPAAVDLRALEEDAVVLAVVARRPSLYIDFERAAWDSLSHVEKWRRIETASDLVSGNGFDGVLLRDEEGRPLGQWIRGRGVALLDGTAPVGTSGVGGVPGR
jgi:hypothetical protein